jgi:hypothetical protein
MRSEERNAPDREHNSSTARTLPDNHPQWLIIGRDAVRSLEVEAAYWPSLAEASYPTDQALVAS